MQRPIEPVKADFKKYQDIGKSYVTPIDEAVESGKGELSNRIEIVPYTSKGDRDTLGLNTIACLEAISSILDEAQGQYEGYEEICKLADHEEYLDAHKEYEAAMARYEKWHAQLGKPDNVRSYLQ